MVRSTAQCLKRQPEFSRLDKSRTFFLLGLTFVMVLLIGASIFYIGTHVEVVEIGYQINQSLAKKQQLIEENQRLTLEIARLKSPTRIETEAKQTFELAPPNPEQIVYLSKLGESSLAHTLETPASPTPSPVKTVKPPVAKKPLKKAPSKPQQVAKKTIHPRKSKSSTKPITQKIIIAKMVRGETTKHSSLKVNSKKHKATVPAVLLDPMP